MNDDRGKEEEEEEEEKEASEAAQSTKMQTSRPTEKPDKQLGQTVTNKTEGQKQTSLTCNPEGRSRQP
ncbi:hypothetical protein PoB_007539900 [Plakobranchus ocellatus]|uniref:Uncharacterized protein n=1 Tax=Plakobranchus ocellatus TaxID=259542 RepID=A0AAV4DXF2_9GAST|nr:hypothetical protein PoB_007539900 [Plakobranchus ocellatus]